MLEATPPASGCLARADLLRLLHLREAGQPQHLSLACSSEISQDVGYWQLPAPETPAWVSAGTINATVSTSLSLAAPVSSAPVQQLESMWLVTEHTKPETAPPQQSFEPLAPLTEQNAKAPSTAPPPAFEDLVPRARLMPLLKRLLQQQQPGALDVPKIVDHISQRRMPQHWPRKLLARWPGQLIVVLDFSEHLYPFHQDMHRLCHWLIAVFGRTSLSLRLVQQGPGAWSNWHEHQREDFSLPAEHPWHMPPPGSAVLVASDFALAVPHSAGYVARWQAFGHSLRQAGCLPFALVPLGAPQIPPALARAYTLVRWSPDAPAQPQRPPQHADDWAATSQVPGLAPLLAMIASTHRVDPPLLRALRQINTDAPRNAGLEAAAWNHPDVEAGSACWVANDPAKNQPHQHLFAQNPAWHPPVRALVTRHHGHLRAGLNHEETLRWAALLTPAERAQPATQQALQQAHGYFQALLGSLTHSAAGADTEKWWRYADRLVHGVDPAVRQQAPDLFHRFAQLLAPRWLAGGHTTVPAWVDPQRLETRANPVPYWLVHDFASGAALLQSEPPQPRQSLLAGPLRASALTVQTSHRATAQWLQLAGPAHRLPIPAATDTLTLRHANEALTLAHLSRPAWASEWGQDRAGPYALRRSLFGAPWRFSPLANEEEVVKSTGAFAYGHDEFGNWASLQIQAQTQTLRYLPPGSFLMGSPPDEPGRDANEGPQHPVTLTEGLWLADTACTQGLWLAVMGDNPSYFTGDLELPVEQVSWEDVQAFLAKLQAHLPPGVQAVLPTEAQWEYACRAGTTTPFSFGQNINSNLVNYDGNYPYNKGPKGEYREKTVAVKALPANAWGLYQMHGNVWEWCADGMRQYSGKSVTNPSGAQGEKSASFAVRGGSWILRARHARSAQRNHYVPGGRFGYLGFRFALRSTAQPGAGGPALVGRSPGIDLDGRSPPWGRDGPVLAARSAARKK